MKKEITGMMIYYYYVCHKKLWYFLNDINMESGNEDVQIGKVIDEEMHSNVEKHININNVISIDYIKSKNILYEVKKSKAIEEASIKQVQFYLYYIKKHNIKIEKAVLDYPLLKQSKEIILDKESEEEIDQTIEEIEKIMNMKVPPETIKKKICKKCSYYDICFL